MIQINWDAIPEVYNWAAADAEGQLWAYQNEPRYSEAHGQWYTPPPHIKLLPLLLREIDLTGIDWRQTLTRRPAHSEKPNTHSGNCSEKPNS